MSAGHTPIIQTYRVPVRTKAGRTKGYRTRRALGCSCGQALGASLDYIDTKRRWRAHLEVAL